MQPGALTPALEDIRRLCWYKNYLSLISYLLIYGGRAEIGLKVYLKGGSLPVRCDHALIDINHESQQMNQASWANAPSNR